MPLQITARNVALSPAMRTLVETKANRLLRLVDQISAVEVIVNFQRGIYSVEVVVKTHSFRITAAERNSDLRAAIDAVMGKIERQLHKQIGKRRTTKRHPRPGPPRRALTLTLNLAGEAVEESLEEAARIVRSNRIAAKPMSVEEAADQLEIQAGSFLVFENAESDRINIIYRREDGRFGLIEPP